MPYLAISLGLFRLPPCERFGRFGDLSYGIYIIYGFPVQQLVFWWFGGSVGVGLLFAVAYLNILLVAFASWHLIERPALSLKRLVGRRKAESQPIPEVLLIVRQAGQPEPPAESPQHAL